MTHTCPPLVCILTRWLQPLLPVLLFFYLPICIAMPPILTLPNNPSLDHAPLSLIKYTSVLEDPARTLTINDVRRPDIAGRFTLQPSATEAFNFSYTRSAYWLRLTLSNNSPAPLNYLLQIREAILNHIEFHHPLGNGTYQTIITGGSLPFSSRPFANRYFVFPITLAANTTTDYYLRIETRNAMLIPIYLWPESAFHEYDRNDYLTQAWYFGMASAIMLFNFLLFISFRDRIYLLYTGFISGTVLVLAAKNGLAKEFLWPNSVLLSEHGFSFSIVIGFFALITFMRKMLNTQKLAPKLDIMLKAAMAICALLLPGFIISSSALAKFAAIIYLAISLLILYVSLYCTLKGRRSAFFFLAAFTMLLTGAVLSALRGLGLAPTNFLSTNGLQLGSAMEMILLAFALADRLNILLRKKEQAQKEALEAQQHLLENLQSHECELEFRVQQRSTELATSNQTLLDMNTELKTAYKNIDSERKQAEQAQQAAIHALNELRAAQTRLIQAEKMAALGQLISDVAYQINGPINTIQAAGIQIVKLLRQTLADIPDLFRIMMKENTTLFFKLARNTAKTPLPDASSQTTAAWQSDPARALLENHAKAADYLPLLEHPNVVPIMTTISHIVGITLSTRNINQATEQVNKTILALKAFSHFDHEEIWIPASVQDGLETVLTIFQSTIQQTGILRREYQPVPLLICLPDQLNQAWSHLIHNAMQAMQEKGRLTIGLYEENNQIVVSIGDTGCGMSPAIQEKVLDFTGSNENRGLNIVNKIIKKHQGRIEIRSDAGQGCQFLVYLPQKTKVDQ